MIPSEKYVITETEPTPLIRDLFDYGDEWRFQVKLESIQQDVPLPKKPRMVEAKGENPEQYPGCEEEE